MKKLVSCMLVVVMLCFVFTTVVAGAGFVPSVSYKPAPEIVEIEGQDDGAMVVVSVDDLNNGVDLVLPEEIKKDLKEQFEKLSDAEIKASDLVAGLSDEVVIKDLFAISNSDVNADLFEGGKTVDVVLKSDVKAGETVYAIVYANGAWKKVPVKNNGNGTITVTLSNAGVLALMTAPAGADVAVPETGDNTNMGLWFGLAASCAALIVVLAVAYRRSVAKEGK